ncbi:MAG: hypothetical protein KKB51_11265 [Candidatus Riflebacteria bacterium]|nr:hypothetical protein [Candidatus Riflebacteria bacterium]
MPDYPVNEEIEAKDDVISNEVDAKKNFIKRLFTEELDSQNEPRKAITFTYLRFLVGFILTLSYLCLLKSITFVPETIVWGSAMVLSNIMSLPLISLLHSGYSRTVKQNLPYYNFLQRYNSSHPPRGKSGKLAFFADIFGVWTVCMFAWPLGYVLFLAQVNRWLKTKNLPQAASITSPS